MLSLVVGLYSRDIGAHSVGAYSAGVSAGGVSGVASFGSSKSGGSLEYQSTSYAINNSNAFMTVSELWNDLGLLIYHTRHIRDLTC